MVPSFRCHQPLLDLKYILQTQHGLKLALHLQPSLLARWLFLLLWVEDDFLLTKVCI